MIPTGSGKTKVRKNKRALAILKGRENAESKEYSRSPRRRSLGLLAFGESRSVAYKIFSKGAGYLRGLLKGKEK